LRSLPPCLFSSVLLLTQILPLPLHDALPISGLASPACALCSRPRTLFHSYEDGQRICTSCYSRLRVAICVVCERQDQRIMAVTDAGPVCGRCHQKTRPREACAECGRNRVLTHARDDGRGYCR